MPSFRTILRAVVMFVAAIVVVKGWHSFGPSVEQLKSLANQGLYAAQQAMKKPDSAASAGTTQPNSEIPELGPLSFTPGANAEASILPVAAMASTDPPLAVADGGAANTTPSEPLLLPMRPKIDDTPELPSISPIPNSDRLPALMARLENLGGIDSQLMPWGSSGRLYRCYCRAALSGAPGLTRHFEAVAAEPHVAVENVLAKIEAWRRTGQAGGGL